MSSPTSWWSRAACRGVTYLFYPTTDDARQEPDMVRDAREAQCRTICRACPVLDACTLEVAGKPDVYAAAFMAGAAPNERAAVLERRVHEPRLTDEQLGVRPKRLRGTRYHGGTTSGTPTQAVQNALGSVRSGDVLDRQAVEFQRSQRERAS